MTSPTGAAGYRPTSTPAPAASTQKQAAAPALDAETQAKIAEQQKIMDGIKAKPKDKLTEDDRTNYANASGAKKLYENSAYLSYLGKEASVSLGKKLTGDMEKFLKDNPTASPEAIEKHMTERFKARIGEATVGKFVFDQALKAHQENMERMKDVFDF
jgi:hypothetical protein